VSSEKTMCKKNLPMANAPENFLWKDTTPPFTPKLPHLKR